MHSPDDSTSDLAASDSGLETRIDAVLARIDRAAERAGRDPQEVTVLLATKTRTAGEVAEAVAVLQQRGRPLAVGENRAQEIAKHADPELAGSTVPRHFIGRIQTNKAKDVVAFADVVESVDRDGLIAALERRCELADVTRPVMIQVNTSGEESKGGYPPETAAVAAALDQVADSAHLEAVGLMTIGANTTDEQAVRESLSLLRRLRDDLDRPGVRELSMGMSTDLEIAVEEGATIVRVGSAVFGPRPV